MSFLTIVCRARYIIHETDKAYLIEAEEFEDWFCD